VTEQASNVVNTAALWLMLGSALRMMAASGHQLSPVGSAFWRGVWCKDRPAEECMRMISNSMDRLYMRLLSAVTTPASATLLYGGFTLIGLGLSMTTSGAILRLVDYRAYIADILRWTGTPIAVVGISCVMAAISSRRTLSMWVSAALILAGLGIGVVTGTMHGR
jgi:hypothetical protein